MLLTMLCIYAYRGYREKCLFWSLTKHKEAIIKVFTEKDSCGIKEDNGKKVKTSSERERYDSMDS